MADELTLQSFVVKLKYVVDQTSEKQFQTSVKNGIEGINKFRLALFGIAIGAEEAVRRTAGSLSSLAGLAREVGVSARQIELGRAAMEGAHGTAQEYDAALKSLANQFRLMPGLIRNAQTLFQTTDTDASKLLLDAGKRYHDLVQQFGAGSNQVAAFLNNLQAVFPNIYEQTIKLGTNWERQSRYAQEANDIYARFFKTVAGGKDAVTQATEAGEDMDEQFFRVGKTLEVAFAAFLTRKGPNGESVADAIEHIANRLANWLGDDATQQKFTAFIDNLTTLLPIVEEALSHIQAILVIIGTVMAVNFGARVVGSVMTLIGAFRSLQGVLYGVRTAATEAAAAEALAAAGGGGPGGSPGIKGPLKGRGIGGFLNFLPWVAAAYDVSQASPEEFDPNSEISKKKHQAIIGGLDDMTGGWFTTIFGAPGRAKDWITGKHAEGGIVPSMLHAGEMVLPASLSLGLQSFFGGGGSGIFSALGETSRRMLNSFLSWFAGDTSYKPVVALSDETVDALIKGFEDAQAAEKKAPDGADGGDGWGAGAYEHWHGGGGAAGGGDGGGAAPDGVREPRGTPPTLPEPGGPATVPKFGAGTSRQQAMDYFVSQGWTKEQAAGIVANLETESELRSTAKGDKGHAYGIGQWHEDRQAAFKQVFGHDIRESTFAEQLAFVQWELQHTEKAAGERLKAATTGPAAAGAISQYYERPRDVQGNIRLRGSRAAGILAGYQPGQTVTGTTTTNLPHPDTGGPLTTPPDGGPPSTPRPDAAKIAGNEGGLVTDTEGRLRPGTKQINANVISWLNTALKNALPGWHADIAVGPSQHTKGTYTGGAQSQVPLGMAADIRLVDPSGKVMPHLVAHSAAEDAAIRASPAFQAFKKLGDAYVLASGGQGRFGGDYSLADTMQFGTIAPGYPMGARANRQLYAQAARLAQHAATMAQTPTPWGQQFAQRHWAAAHQQAARATHHVMESKVAINVYGNDNPSSTAKAVEQTQSRVAANHLRHMRTTVA